MGGEQEGLILDGFMEEVASEQDLKEEIFTYIFINFFISSAFSTVSLFLLSSRERKVQPN